MENHDAYRAVADAISFPVVLTGIDGTIVATNRRFEALYGVRTREITGRRLSELSADPEKTSIFLATARLGAEPIPGALSLILADGSSVDCRIEGAAIREPGTTTRAGILVRFEPQREDRFGLLTGKIEELDAELRRRLRLEEEREQLLAAEQHARREAEEASRLKDEFLATLSHELRTPLTAVLGWSRMLASTQFDRETQRTAIDSIRRAAEAQAKLIDDLLELSQITTGKLRMNISAVDLAETVAAAVDALRPAAEAKKQQLRVSMERGTCIINGDPERIQQIVWNLVSNSVKFTPKGGSISVELIRQGSSVEIVVTDSGMGITPAFLPHVFDRFRQADATTTRQFGGLGLGLSLVRELTQAHGGWVRAESEGENRGARLTVALPLPAMVQTAPQTVPIAGRHRTPLGGVRVLVVEDQADARHMLEVLLRHYGAKVTAFASVRDALEWLDSSQSDVIVSDIEMPDQDGYSLLTSLRERGSTTPVIALTAFAHPQDRARALEAGFRLHISKPIDPDQFVQAIARLVQLT